MPAPRLLSLSPLQKHVSCVRFIGIFRGVVLYLLSEETRDSFLPVPIQTQQICASVSPPVLIQTQQICASVPCLCLYRLNKSVHLCPACAYTDSTNLCICIPTCAYTDSTNLCICALPASVSLKTPQCSSTPANTIPISFSMMPSMLSALISGYFSFSSSAQSA